MAHGYMVIVKFTDDSEDMVFNVKALKVEGVVGLPTVYRNSLILFPAYAEKGLGDV